MKHAVIIKTGDTFPAISNKLQDFEDWIIQGLGVDPAKVKIVDVPRGEDLPSREECSGAVIAGSHAMVTQDLDWSLSIEAWIPDLIAAGIPVLGICYGHQLLARAMGGVVDYHPQGLEIGTVGIERQKLDESMDSDALFKDLPDRFDVHVCHSQTVIQLPKNAVLIAKNQFESHEVFRIGTSAWGVQFHPEYDEIIMTAYAENMEQSISSSGQALSEILKKINPTPVAAKILKRFGQLIT
ncbi:MAG: glutamine amidotransferase [Desulfobacula sp.]|nr:glutamine amidotransferase [Desulfobacula sp.]